MYFAPLHEYLPKLAGAETRSIISLDYPSLPDDTYSLIEAYCTDPKCDCRRVMFNIFASEGNEALAVIAYGWESESFYARWLGRNDPKVIRQLQGPVLNPGSPHTELAPTPLQIVEEILQDEDYVARLQRHYKLFKRSLRKKRRPRKPKPRRRKRR